MSHLLIRWMLVLLFWIPFIASALTPEHLSKPPSNQWIADYANILAPDELTQLNERIRTHQQTHNDEIVIVILPSLNPENTDTTPMPVKDFATALFNDWRIGQKNQDNGLLIFLVMDQRRIEFITGYGLEGMLPDALAWRIQKEHMIEPFRQQQYAQGLNAGLTEIIQLLERQPRVANQLPAYNAWQIASMGLSAPFIQAPDVQFATSAQTYGFYIARFVSFWLIFQVLWFLMILLYEKNWHLLLRWQAAANISTESTQAQPHSPWLFGPLTVWLPLAILIYDFFQTDTFWQWAQHAVVLMIAVIILLGLYALYSAHRSPSKIQAHTTAGDHQRHQEYTTTVSWRYISMFFLSTLPLMLYECWYRKNLQTLRIGTKNCVHCQTVLQRLPYEQAQHYLSQRQRSEEQHNFADFDVWSCPSCQQTEVLNYTPSNKNNASLSECEQCHEKTRFLLRTSTTRNSTQETLGEAQEFYQCLNCHHLSTVVIALPLLPSPDQTRDHDRPDWRDDDTEDTRASSSSSSQDDHDFGGGTTGGGGAGSNW